jgi:adenylyltransferase/sulfurtransferase
MDSYVVQYQRKEECYSHDPLEEVIALKEGVADLTVGQLLAEARRLLGPAAELELGRDVVEKLVCPRCGTEEILFASLGQVLVEQALCPRCPGVRREVRTFYKIRGGEAFLGRTPAQIGVPPFDILIARCRDRAVGLELAGDAQAVLGPLAASREAG